MIFALSALGLAMGLYLFYRIAFHATYRPSVPVLAYHHVNPGAGFPATKLSMRSFQDQMLELKKRDYLTLSVPEFLEARKKPSSNRVLITFDDAYKTVYENALPILTSLQYTATLFVISGYMGKTAGWDVACGPAQHMDETELRKAVALGFSIGSHTVTHPDLTQLTSARLRDELTDSRRRLEDIAGAPVTALAYPFGRYNRRVQDAVRDAGYLAAFTINRPMRQYGFNPFAIPATGIYGIDTLRNFMSKVEQGAGFGILTVRDKIINRFASGTTLVKGAGA